MKHLIIVSHFDTNSLTFAVKKRAQHIYSERGHEHRVLDLHAEKFNPVYGPQDLKSIYGGAQKPTEIQRYQSLINWADHLLFIYPLWWTGLPAMLKGFIDRVFTSGFATSYIDGELRGMLAPRTATLITLYGMPPELYDRTGMIRSLTQTTDEGIFAVCGIKPTHYFFGNSMSPDGDARTVFLESLADKL